MKKLIVMLVMCFSVAQVCVAQDVIVTREAKRIDASVLEISDTEVRYKRQDNPDGPVFVIKTSEIASIVFANGDVQVFNTVAPSQMTNEAPPNTQDGNYSFDVPTVVSKGHIVRYTPGVQMKYEGFSITYNGVELNKDACEDFFKATCPDAYKKYNSAVWVGYVGDAFLEVGACCLIWGLIYGATKEPDANASEIDIENNTTAWLAAGLTGIVLSIPFYVGKYSLKTKAVETFNAQCGYRPQGTSVASLSFRVSPMGAGLALNF